MTRLVVAVVLLAACDVSSTRPEWHYRVGEPCALHIIEVKGNTRTRITVNYSACPDTTGSGQPYIITPRGEIP